MLLIVYAKNNDHFLTLAEKYYTRRAFKTKIDRLNNLSKKEEESNSVSQNERRFSPLKKEDKIISDQKPPIKCKKRGQ
jgi:hypothetical protein